VDYLQKVLWSEGMFLTPHHFQQWDRFHENQLQQRMKFAAPQGWGVTDLKINEDALGNGELIVAKCSGVFPDGLLVDVPGLDEPPKSRQIGPSFDPKRETLAVFLASPLARAGSVTCREEGVSADRPARYRRKGTTIADSNTGSNEREIGSAVKDLRIRSRGRRSRITSPSRSRCWDGRRRAPSS